MYYTDKLGLASSDPSSPYHTGHSPYINRQSDSRQTNNKKIDDSSPEYDGEAITPEMVRDCMYGKAYIDERMFLLGSTIVEWKYGQCFIEPLGRHKRAYVVARWKPSNSTTLKNGKTYPCAKVMDAYSKRLQGIPAITVRVYRIMCQNEKTFEEIYHFTNGNEKPTLLGFRDINELSRADRVGYGSSYQGGVLSIGLFRTGLIGIRFHIEATDAKDGWHIFTVSNKSYYFGE